MSIIQNIKNTVQKAMNNLKDVVIESFPEGDDILVTAKLNHREDLLAVSYASNGIIEIVVFDSENNIIGQMIPSLINAVYHEPVSVLEDALKKELAKQSINSTKSKLTKIKGLKTGS